MKGLLFHECWTAQNSLETVDYLVTHARGRWSHNLCAFSSSLSDYNLELILHAMASVDSRKIEKETLFAAIGSKKRDSYLFSSLTSVAIDSDVWKNTAFCESAHANANSVSNIISGILLKGIQEKSIRDEDILEGMKAAFITTQH